MLYSIRHYPVFFFTIMAPSILLVGFLIVYPLLNGVRLSFTDATPLRPTEAYVGLDNFSYILEDDEFFEVIYNTLLMIGTATIIALIGGFSIALLLNTGIRLVNFFRAAIFQIWVVPWIVVAILWGWLFNGDYGLVNHMLRGAGLLDGGFSWLFHPQGSQIAIIAAFAWRSIPFMMVISLAALQSIPKELLESASMDGAGFFDRLFYVILPLVRNILLVAALLQGVRFFQEMTIPWVTTQGGPGNATMVLSMYTYKLAFDDWDFGLASTVGTLWLCFLLLFSFIYLRMVLKEVQ